jgi:pyruvate/2-oxoglutarate dehydrogenase complex dihydrolipoamide dehydrogenase (E3) component
MKHIESQAIVVGAGQAGPTLAVKLARSGLQTVLVERGELGGTCVNNGCTPTKTLVASARVAHLARRARDFGVLLDAPVRIDARAVRDRALAVVQKSRDGLLDWIEGTANLRLVRGEARFASAHALQVGDLELRGERIFLNVGARPIVPDWVARAGVPWLTNESILGLDTIPEHLVILGAGYIALEYAQIHRRFGARVTVIEHGPRFLPREDEDTAAAVRAVLEGEGIEIRTGLAGTALRAGTGGRGIELDVAPSDPATKQAQGAPGAHAGGERIAGSHLLVAVGRRPNTDTLGLDAAGIATGRDGTITVDEELRTNLPHVWALGDANGRGAFTHTSYNDQEIVAANLLGDGTGPRRQVGDRIPAYALFTDPPLARIGMNKDAARAAARTRGLRVQVGHRPMTRVARAVERGETEGFMEALVDADSGRLLGATIFGVEGDEVIHALLDVMAAGQPAASIARTMHIHPTVSELLPTMLQELEPLQ